MNLTARQLEIIEVSVGLIAEKGIQNLTTKNLSDKIGISEAALYRHFSCKREILLTLLNMIENRFDQIISRINNEDISYAEKVEKIFLSRIEEFSKKPNIAKVIFSEEIFQNEPELSDKVYAIIRKTGKTFGYIIERAVEEGQIRSDVSPQHISLIILGSLRLTVTRWRMSKFSFDLVKEGNDVWNSIKILISKEA